MFGRKKRPPPQGDLCIVCHDHSREELLLCPMCRKHYAVTCDNSTRSAILWAAERSRDYERARAKRAMEDALKDYYGATPDNVRRIR